MSITNNIPHDSAESHVCGTSQFIGDILQSKNELIVDFIISTEAHAEIKNIDLSKAEKIEGIIGLYLHKDIPSAKPFGAIVHDEYLIAKGKVEYYGQPVVIIAGETRESVNEAKKSIQINYNILKPILSIEEAIKNNKYINYSNVEYARHVKRGNPEKYILKSENFLEGRVFCAGQEHFYLEMQTALVIPEENGNLKVLSSTQNPTEVQNVIAEMLNISANKIVVETKRMGGAFGGKESQGTHYAAMAALVAYKTNRPAKIVLDRETDMLTTGKRHPFRADYKVAFSDDAKINALELNLFSDGGYAADLSTSIMDRAILHSDNAYFIPHIKVTGKICKTNYAPNTAFRGFGAPQGIFCIESIIEDIAVFLRNKTKVQIDSYDIRKNNLYRVNYKVEKDAPERNENNITPYGQIVENNTLSDILQEIEVSSEYKKRLNEISDFNNNEINKKHGILKGISCIPLKFGISFTAKHLNQANALVNIYTDGSIQVSTGGTEMGQGLNTKLRQITANEFCIKVDKVRIMPTSTEKNNNTSPTAASSGFDLNGNAVIKACREIKKRLIQCAAEYFNSDKPDVNSVTWNECGIFDACKKNSISFEELVKIAYFKRISLGERGFYATPLIDNIWTTDKGNGKAFRYFTNGAAVSEVEIDRFTGDVKVKRADILMDIGKSINPEIDKGQIIGAFIQGMGWATIEELKYSDQGKLLTDSPATYKIPSINDIPEILNFDYFSNENEANADIGRCKAVGEPPFVLGISVWTAVKNALSYVGNDISKELTLPATPEKILKLLSSANKKESLVNEKK